MSDSKETCLICGALMRPSFSALVLNRHSVGYWYCERCQHLRTGAPWWLEEAYADPIANSDTGLVVRNLKIARRLVCVLDALFPRSARFLDAAGGTGLLVRLMRDAGFDFYWEDSFCENSLARGFEASENGRFDAVTAIEVMEHIHDPLAFVRGLIARSTSRSLLFTTELFDSMPPNKDWWYYSFPTGQHISFFTLKTLDTIAQQLGLRFMSYGGLHLFTGLPIEAKRFSRLVKGADRSLLEKLLSPKHMWIIRRRGELTQSDHERLLAKLGR